jgi:hypothetical protein
MDGLLKKLWMRPSYFHLAVDQQISTASHCFSSVLTKTIDNK